MYYGYSMGLPSVGIASPWIMYQLFLLIDKINEARLDQFQMRFFWMLLAESKGWSNLMARRYVRYYFNQV